MKSAAENNQSLGYTGEQTYPLHTHIVKQADKPHTLLYGYLPLNGKIDVQEIPVELKNSGKAEISAAGYMAELEWPFGSWDGTSLENPACECTGTVEELVKNPCDHFGWSAKEFLQVRAGRPKRAMANWLIMLIQRYQIFDININDNSKLRNVLQSIPLLSKALNPDEMDLMNHQPSDFSEWIEKQNYKKGSLWDYISQNYDLIMEWYVKEEKNHAGNKIKPEEWSALPELTDYLYLTKSRAEEIREAMLFRAEKTNQLVEVDLPLPRYTQGKDERYFIVPFVRYYDECGCEQLQWGKTSMEFTVANPFDPLATRPSVIQLPELSDITKGFPKGVTFLTPKSISDMMMKVSPTMDMEPNASKSPLSACMGFSISFNIPIITICAMILLMIVLNLLNIIFRWIPYAILMLPRLCGR